MKKVYAVVISLLLLLILSMNSLANENFVSFDLNEMLHGNFDVQIEHLVNERNSLIGQFIYAPNDNLTISEFLIGYRYYIYKWFLEANFGMGSWDAKVVTGYDYWGNELWGTIGGAINTKAFQSGYKFVYDNIFVEVGLGLVNNSLSGVAIKPISESHVFTKLNLGFVF